VTLLESEKLNVHTLMHRNDIKMYFWLVQPGPDAIGIVAISHGCPGVAARACSLVGLEPSKVVEVLKDRPSWLPDCRRLSILGSFPTANGGTVELLYTQVS
jgi:homeobox-leucine zipper protein